MDLNELYRQHQISVARAATDDDATQRASARGFAERIADLQRLAGAARPTAVLAA